MSFWETFLKSLETDGGKLFVTIGMIIFLSAMAALMVETHHPLQETGRTLMASAFSSLMTILLGYLAKKAA